jgi:hypothetical protein
MGNTTALTDLVIGLEPGDNIGPLYVCFIAVQTNVHP